MSSSYKILSKINDPSDLKKLDLNQLNRLADELAAYIHEIIYELGGHYSSPLGVVELTIALHYVYNTPEDKLVWDVGHQAYPHKILTGRREAFKKIRQRDGISGFLKIDESPYDCYGAGHTSTSISAALGFAHMRDKNKSNEKVLAIIGDGAMTGGLAYEALNNLGYHRTQLTVVLNDNSLSISESVGALSKYLTKITTNPIYNKLRSNVKDITEKVPVISDHLKKILKKTESGMKVSLTDGGFFEELGIRYIGPIDGHDLNELIRVFKTIKEIDSPVLLHIYTNKSKRIKHFNSNDAVKYYSLSGSKKKNNLNSITFSKVFGKSVLSLAKDFDFRCITAAMDVGTGLSEFSKLYADRYIDVGIAEQHALTYSSGISASGNIPIVAIYSTFIQRAFDQIIHDIAIQNLPLIICMDRAGLVGPDGPTHHGIFDISFLRMIPNVIVTSPKDGFELHDLLFTALKVKKIFSIRYGKIDTNYKEDYIPKLLEIGSWDNLLEGDDIALLSVGSMVNHALEVAEKLKEKNNLNVGVINCRFIKPLDEKMLSKIMKKYKYIFTIEEGCLQGGFGSSILEYSSNCSYSNIINLIAIDNMFVDHGSRSELLDMTNLSPNKIYNKILEIYE
tara:strand:+ start:207 stop:2069 length:1863 start_codon:yes stop_codon:yes gene_type:complete